MAKFTAESLRRCKEAADFRDFIPGIDPGSSNKYVKCPFCETSGRNKGMQVTAKQAKCWKCGKSFKDVFEAVQHYTGADFKEAAEKVALRYGIQLETEAPLSKGAAPGSKARRQPGPEAEPFFIRQLKASGLDVEDVMATVYPTKTSDPERRSPFAKGGVYRNSKTQNGRNTSTWIINDTDDEMLIYYYDRFGHQRMFLPPGAKTLRPFIRVRYSNPDQHLLYGKPTKYQSPPGSEASFIYIPEKVRELFAAGVEIDTLFIQEGEKKAEKACKHGMMSVAIQGIWNTGNASGLDQELQYLAQALNVKNFVMVMDSDWNNLSSSLGFGDEVTKRPKSFAGAIVKFRKFIRSLAHVGLDPEIYFAHVNANEAGDKGIDDLLCNTLKGQEEELMADVEAAMNSHDGVGVWVNVHPITTISEAKIYNFWHLNDRDAFFATHHEELCALKEFKFDKVVYVAKEGKISVSGDAASEKDLWTVETNKDGENPKIKYSYAAIMEHLVQAGFYKYQPSEEVVGERLFLRCLNGIYEKTSAVDIQEYFLDFVCQISKNTVARDYWMENVYTVLTDIKIRSLKKISVDFKTYTDDSQTYYYKNRQVKVSAFDIAGSGLVGPVWSKDIISREFSRIPLVTNITKEGQNLYNVQASKEAYDCEFFRFILNTSQMEPITDSSPEDKLWEYNQHVVNKMTSIGYLLTHKNLFSERVAIVSEDYTVSNDLKATGGTGKSLIGTAIEHMVNTVMIDGKKDMGDKHLLGLVDRETRVLLVDDVKPNFPFPQFYSVLTGRMEVNKKYEQQYVIKAEDAPKMYISTNYGIKDDSDSTDRRINYMVFSAHYNKEFTPYMEFGHEMFRGWNAEQWNLFDNFMLECLMYYYRSLEEGWHSIAGRGAIPPPMKSVHEKQIVTKIGSAFLDWAEAYFAPQGGMLNKRINRLEMLENLKANVPGDRNTSSRDFSNRLKAFCQLKGYDFNRKKPMSPKVDYREWCLSNPGKPYVGGRDVSNGNEFFCISDSNYDENLFF